MLSFSKLKKIDKSFEIKYGDETNVMVSSISHAYAPLSNTFIFIKNKKFMSEIGRLVQEETFLETGIVFEELFFKSLEGSEEIEALRKKFCWIGCVKNVNSAMCLFSKPFYDLTYGSQNYSVDGRQMGTASIDPEAQISQNVFIGEHVVIENDVTILPGVVILPHVHIKMGTIIYPNTTIYPFVKIGKNCRIHSNATIGSDGFGYNFVDGKHQKIWHLCGVEISDDVEIGASTKVDAGAFIPTRIGKGTKIDNLVQISHNAQIGEFNIFAGKSGVAGSAETGRFCVFGAGAGASPGARLGEGCQLAAQSLVSENAIIPAGSILSGHPARPLKEWLKSQAKLRQLIKNK